MNHAATKLLDDFRKLPGRVESPRTFMEIAGYPHYENACSNILAFFVDTEEPHRLGTLMLDALASAVDIVSAGEGLGGNVSIEREFATDSGNRIDLLIESDDRAILIENKIYAGVSNPFGDYTDYLDRRTPEGRAKHKLLLTLYPTNEGSEWGFTNLTYEEFVQQIRSLLGRYVSTADARYLTMFLDFLNTLENLRRGTRMDREFVQFLAERSGDIKSLFNDLKSFRDELRNKVQELNALVEVGQHPSVKQDFWRGPTATMSDVLYYDIPLSDELPVAIDTVISPQEWEIQIFLRRGGDRTSLKALLNGLNIPFEERKRFVHTSRFAYDEDLDQIGPVLQDLINKLATSQKSGR